MVLLAEIEVEPFAASVAPVVVGPAGLAAPVGSVGRAARVTTWVALVAASAVARAARVPALATELTCLTVARSSLIWRGGCRFFV